MDSDSESKLISLFTQIVEGSKLTPLTVQIISLISSLDLESLPKPESEFMSLIAQTKSVFNSMDLDSQPKPLSKLVSIFTELVTNPDSVAPDAFDMTTLYSETLELKPEPKLVSLVYQLLHLVAYMTMKSKAENLVSLCPQDEVTYGSDDDEDEVLYIDEKDRFRSEYYKWKCLDLKEEKVRLLNGLSYFYCENCNGRNHERFEKAPDEIKHALHPKHSLKLLYLGYFERKRKCYCCGELLGNFIYCCLTCDYAMNMACVEKPLVLSRDHREWHEHTLYLFPRKAPLTCNLCGLADSSCPFYICPPCDFSVHRSCLDLPHVIRISRHSHRISFTPSFTSQGDFSCRVCRERIDNDYGGYSCVKGGCSYVAHSRCATQSNVWDGVELEGVPEEIEEVLEPFVRISDGVIKHFSHQHHHMRFDENTGKDYNENKQCRACITPIYFGNFYSCMQCDFVLHEECANLPRKIYTAIHPHMLTLVGEYEDAMEYGQGECSICRMICTSGFFYKCGKKECDFKLHVQCGTISEPLVHGSHIHPLFLTSKPGEYRTCSICNIRYWFYKQRKETFNCIECDFSLCFECAIIPQKVRYMHDKHMFSLCYGNDETSTMASWCEVCERKINPEERFYTCDEDCCVTLHVECVIGIYFTLRLGSSWFFRGRKFEVVANNEHMSRPFCSECKRRCTGKIVFKTSGLIVCSMYC